MKYTKSKIIDNIHHFDFPFHIDYAILKDDYPNHSHDFHELFIVVKGTCIHTINKNRQPLSAGDVRVIKNEDVVHGFTDPVGLELYNYIFDPSLLKEIYPELLQMEGYQNLFILEPFFLHNQGYRNSLQLDYKDLSRVLEISGEILREYRNQQRGFKTLIRSKFLELIVKLSRNYENLSATDAPGKNITGLGKAIVYMEQNFKDKISAGELAHRAALSQRQFLRLFTKCYNTSPVKYLTQLRVKHAVNLLETTDLSLKEISFSSGFSDSNYFSRKFIEQMGISPSAYRKKNVHHAP
jgi:AraC family L-rhamnose operon transcriptional activator RhaR/AraC family L-rhamnose operon regulatory protein RhaS